MRLQIIYLCGWTIRLPSPLFLSIYIFCSYEHLCVSSCTCVSISEHSIEEEFLCQRTERVTTHPLPISLPDFICNDKIYRKL